MEKETAGQEPAFRFSPRPNRASEIHWRTWGEAAFRQAQSERKPILLAISAVWCHWCHVADETTYSDTAVIDAINRDYVAIRVDSDRHPEIDRRYNRGGWPTTALLASTGELLWGGTYLPPAQLHQILGLVKDYYRTNDAKISAQIGQFWGNVERQAPVPPAKGELGAPLVEAVLDSLRDNFDPVHGGFGTEPKFPHTDVLSFALDQYYRTGDEGLGNVVRRSLEGMRNGAIFDRAAGGFFRYATQRDWNTPHFEKMLEDNVALLRLYLRTYKVFDDSPYRGTAEAIHSYLMEVLYDQSQGVFYGSQDADEDYYALDAAGRLQRVAPFVDRTIYVDWNARAVAVYAAAYGILGDAVYRQVALRGMRFLWEHCYRRDVGMCHYWEGEAKGWGLLEDQAVNLLALLDAHEVSGDPDYLDRAEELGALLRREFAAPEGGFYDLGQSAGGRLGLLRAPDRNLADNALVAEGFRRLGVMSGNEQYLAVAEDTLRSFAAEARDQGLLAAGFVDAVARLLRPSLHIVVVGDRHEALTADLFWAATRVFEPGKVAQLVETHSNRLSALGYPASPAPVAYICQNSTCLPPVSDPHKIEPAIRR